MQPHSRGQAFVCLTNHSWLQKGVCDDSTKRHIFDRDQFLKIKIQGAHTSLRAQQFARSAKRHICRVSVSNKLKTEDFEPNTLQRTALFCLVFVTDTWHFSIRNNQFLMLMKQRAQAEHVRIHSSHDISTVMKKNEIEAALIG